MPPLTASSANKTVFGFPFATTCANTYRRRLLGSYTGVPVTPMFGYRSRQERSTLNGEVARSYGVPSEVCHFTAPVVPARAQVVQLDGRDIRLGRPRRAAGDRPDDGGEHGQREPQQRRDGHDG